MPAITTFPTPKSTHTSDPILSAFLGSTFDPTAYLNANLPNLAIPTAAQPIIPSKSSTLSDLTSHSQTHIAQLSAQSARLTTVLTQLTDDILRSGSRLAYSVELLRGETAALNEALVENLAEDINNFVPGGIAVSEDDEVSKIEEEIASSTITESKNEITPTINEPEALTQLRTLHQVRARLQSVMTVFDAALSWPLPPSSISLGTSLISVSGPSTAHPSDSSNLPPQSLEEKGQAAQKKLKDEVMELLSPNGRSAGSEGVLRAEERVEALRDLVEVWKGTSEEKARTKFVEGLAKIVAERRRDEEAKGVMGSKVEEERVKEKGGQGFLRRLREEIYLD